MITPYVYSDLGQQDPNNPTNWAQETVVLLRYQRAGMSTAVQNAVDAFGDHSGATAYKHFVPWDRIFRTLEEACMNKTRNQCHTLLANTLGNLQIADHSGINPTLHRAAYDGWYSWAVEAICDWPVNIYRGPSHGDHGGTALDMPTKPYSDGLRQRLDAARQALRDYIGLNIEYKHSFV